MFMDVVGVKNLFVNFDGGWVDGLWEKIVGFNFDVIVVVDVDWLIVKDKIVYLKKDFVFS